MRKAVVVLSLAIAGRALAKPLEVDRQVVASDARVAAREVLGPGATLSEPVVKESLTGVHVRFRTLAPDGTPVVDQEAAVHLTGAGPTFRVRVVDDPGRGIWTLAGVRRVAEAEARALAGAAAGGRVRRAEAVSRPAGDHVARPVWRVLVDTDRPRRLLEVWVDADDGSVEVGRDLLWHVNGTGMVYRPNPVVVQGTRGLFDNNDADSTLLTSLREQVTLLGLDGSGKLRGEFVDAQNPAGRADQPSLVFDYTRSQPEFEEVNAYYHLDRVQRQIRDLGFTGSKPTIQGALSVLVNSLSDDQSYYDADAVQIQTGTGGVDDAEDADVIIHEYGHAIQDAVVTGGFGNSEDARAIGEGFSDIQAYAMTELTAKTPMVARECLGAWDSTAYDPPTACLRRVDGSKHYPELLRTPREQHYDGELWSGMLYDLFNETGLGRLGGYRLVLESTYHYSPRESLVDAGAALLIADRDLHGGVHVDAIRRVLIRHGFINTLSAPSTVDGTWQKLPDTFSSLHPLPNLQDESKTFTSKGASAMRVHFSAIDMEVDSTGSKEQCPDHDCDAIYVYDGAGLLYARYGGLASDVTSPAIPGDTVVVRSITTPSKQSAGFTIDKVEAVTAAVVLPPDAGPPPRPDAGVIHETGDATGGCGCRAAGGGGQGRGGWLLLAATAGAAAAARRRRRARS